MEIILSEDTSTIDKARAHVLFLASPIKGDVANPLFSERHSKRHQVTCFAQAAGKLLIGVGVGDATRVSPETLRDAAGVAVRTVLAEAVESVVITLPGLLSTEVEVASVTEGLRLGAYVFDKYKMDKHAPALCAVTIQASATFAAAQAQAEILARATVLARDLGNEPPNILRPSVFADAAVLQFADTAASVDVWDEERLQTAGMNGILAVGKGSKHPPRLIAIRYQGDAQAPLVALVGKGITFDTGGISLKSGRDLSNMRLDMAGAAAVVGALDALVAANAKCNVIGLIAAAENVPSAGSMLPGEIIMYRNGLAVQVGNTDAEGRLVLADALIYAGEVGAQTIIDIATLTGSAANALGDRYAAVFGDDALVSALLSAGTQAGDYLWRLPLVDEYESKLDSVYADMNNIGGTAAGAIIAALFLRRFVPENANWAHIDMAGPMEQDHTQGYRPKGATGFGARLLARYVMTASESH